LNTGPDQIERLPRTAAVLLARLLAPVASLDKARKDVAEVVGPPDDDGWGRTVATLADAGLAVVAAPASKGSRASPAKPQPLHLTDAGRTAARDRLGAAADRPKFTATTVERFWEHAQAKPTATVLLTRLYVPAATPPTIKSLRTAVSKIVGPLDDAAWEAAVSALVAAGYTNDPAPPPAPPPSPAAKPVKGPPIALTDAGRSAAQQWLGMDEVPPKLTWAAVRDKWLAAAVVPPAERAAFRDDKRVVGLLLGELLGVGPAPSVTEAIEAAVCHDLGYPQVRHLADVVPLVLGKRLGKPLPPMSPKELAAQVPAVAFNVPKGDAKTLRAAALKRWAASSQAAKPPADDLPSFAAVVNRAAAASPTGWFGPNKVFINHVHRQLADGGSLDAFKRRLVEANTAGLVTLARADLVGAMDPVDVRESETRYLTAEFHFIRVDQGRQS
jgi:hypothetical protein